MIKSAFRYAVVGVLGTALHFGTLYSLVEVYGFDPVFASAIGFVIALTSSYFLNRYWTFEKRIPRCGTFIRYTLISVIGLTLNTVIMFVGVYVLTLPYLMVQLTVIFVVPVVNYLANNWWTFRDTAPFDAV